MQSLTAVIICVQELHTSPMNGKKEEKAEEEKRDEVVEKGLEGDTDRPRYQLWVGKDYYNPFMKDFSELHDPFTGEPCKALLLFLLFLFLIFS